MNDAVKKDNRSKLSENQEVDSSDDDEDPEDRPAEINNIQGGNRTKTPRTKAPHKEIIIESYCIFSSPDTKGHVSYCHHLASVVRP